MTRKAMLLVLDSARHEDSQRLMHLAGLLAGQQGADLPPDEEGARTPHFKPYIAELMDSRVPVSEEGVSLGMVLAAAFNPYHAPLVLKEMVQFLIDAIDEPQAPHAARKCGAVLGIFEVMSYLDEEWAGDGLADEADLHLPGLLERLLLAPGLRLDEIQLQRSMWPGYSRYRGRLSEAIKKYVRYEGKAGGSARREVVHELLLAVAHEVNYPSPRSGQALTTGELTSKFGYEVLDHLWYALVGTYSPAERLSMVGWLSSNKG